MKNETATSSKAKMEELFGATGTLKAEIGKITAELGNGQDKLGKLIADADGKAALNFSTSYTAFGKAVTDANTIIDEALKSNDLTELDTTNLKALRSYINETKDTFDAALKESGLSATGDNQTAALTDEALGKLKAGLSSAKELENTATEKATTTNKFSQNQPETVADIRESLR